MELMIDQSHAAILLLSMSISRQNVKKAFKKRGDQHLLNQYDAIKSHLEQNIDDSHESNTNRRCRLLLNVDELEMVREFISWYAPKTREVLNQATNNKIKQVDQEQLNALETIKHEIEVGNHV